LNHPARLILIRHPLLKSGDRHTQNYLPQWFSSGDFNFDHIVYFH
jgi:hypothetical protein